MAFDEALVNIYSKSKQPVLRLYGWKPAGISVGKYQEASADISKGACREDGVIVVRRLTGGGAIFHDKELTYSVVCSEDDIGMKNKTVKESFEKLTSFILAFYKSLGLDPRYAKDALSGKKLGRRAAFCFSDCEEYDIMIRGKKMGGNAQARKKGVIFQHGSIPLMVQTQKIECYFSKGLKMENYCGLNDLLEEKLSLKDAAGRFTDAFVKTFGLRLEEKDFTVEEEQIKEKLIDDKYSLDEWNFRK